MVPFGSIFHLRRSAFTVFWLQVIEGIEENLFSTFVTEKQRKSRVE
jgi:hypothetical protein